MFSNKELAYELQNAVSQLGSANALKHSHSKLKGAEKRILFLVLKLKEGQPVMVSEIANNIGVTFAAVTHQINALEKKGCVKRIADKNDRRIVLVSLTEEGRAQVKKIKDEFKKKIIVLADFLGEKDTKELIRLVKKISKFPGFDK